MNGPMEKQNQIMVERLDLEPCFSSVYRKLEWLSKLMGNMTVIQPHGPHFQVNNYK